MNFQELFRDQSIKPKEKSELVSNWIVANPNEVTELIDFAMKSKDSIKASCIEAIEFATKIQPEIGSAYVLDFVCEALKEKAPRIKWESARVIGNIAHQHPENLDEAIINLLKNSEHSGTVVRWSAAFALSQILKIQTSRNIYLIPAVESICQKEEKNSIKKIYLDVLKRVKK